MDHVVIAIYFVGFIGWFAWCLTTLDQANKDPDSDFSRASLTTKLFITLFMAAISYAFLLALFLGASWLVHRAIDALYPSCIGTGC